MGRGEVSFRPEALVRFGAILLGAVGVPSDISEVVATHLVDANLAGHDSHGVIRLPEYVRQVQDGVVVADGRPVTVMTSGSMELVSGEWGFGQVAGLFAIARAVEVATEVGIAAVGVIRCTHLGRFGAYMERSTAAGCIGLGWVGGLGLTHAAVPFGGSRGAYGANPIAAGFPVAHGDAIVVDFATTAVAGGKVLVAHAAGDTLPAGSIVDRDGEPTTDPAAFLAGGALLAFGGHKGYGLAVLAELLGQALTGSEIAGDEGHGGETFSKAGAFFIVIDPGRFRNADEVGGAAGRFIERVHSVPPAKGYERVYVPGEVEAITRRKREESGIALADVTWNDIARVANELGVETELFPVPL